MLFRSEARRRSVSDVQPPVTVRAWMIGSNPRLADQAPIELLHHEKMTAAVRAADAFILEG